MYARCYDGRAAEMAVSAPKRHTYRLNQLGSSSPRPDTFTRSKPATGPLRGLMPKNLILIGREEPPPFLVGLRHLELLRFGEEPSGTADPSTATTPNTSNKSRRRISGLPFTGDCR